MEGQIKERPHCSVGICQPPLMADHTTRSVRAPNAALCLRHKRSDDSGGFLAYFTDVLQCYLYINNRNTMLEIHSSEFAGGT